MYDLTQAFLCVVRLENKNIFYEYDDFYLFISTNGSESSHRLFYYKTILTCSKKNIGEKAFFSNFYNIE